MENQSFELDRSVNDKESVNGRYGGKAAGSRPVESQVVVKDDLMEPSLQKYVDSTDWSRSVSQPGKLQIRSGLLRSYSKKRARRCAGE